MKLECDIILPASKSESNRALMIGVYGGFAPDFSNLSDSNDTLLLNRALNKVLSVETTFGQNRATENATCIIDVSDCGTAARFLTTFLACREGDWCLIGTERMKHRPMKPLVDALLELGAEIQYVEEPGFLPLRIKGKSLLGGKTSIDMTQSSQFASSLLLAAPMFPRGLELELKGELSSLPYMEMTHAMMRHFGAEVERKGRTLVVKSKPYQKRSIAIEADWTAASYWYEMAAFSEECEIRLKGLRGLSPLESFDVAWQSLNQGLSRFASLQGDAVIVDWMRQVGVGTFVENDAVVLRKIPFEKHPLCFDFSHHPDLYPTLAATCAGLGIETKFIGLDNLHIKESDRVKAVETELAKLGGGSPLCFCSHNDHRIVMALAPLALLIGPVSFDHPEVVEKSYPGFWDDMSVA